MSKHKHLNAIGNPFLLLLFCLAISRVGAQNGPQPCPENPIVLTGSDFAQYVYSPYDEFHHYPPSTDCRFVLVARTLQRRIQLNVIESQLEEPLFTDCKDFVSVRDGALPTSQELLRWCGSFYPPSLTSSGDSLYIHFHSDNIIQSRGFNLSFTDYELPGCPPDWIVDPEFTSCYKLFDSVHGYTFVDAQKVCFYERANLLTIESASEYNFVSGQYSGSHSFPWIGYNDANKEGVFDPIDPNVKLWPENFPVSKSDHSDKDCVFLDWNVKEGTAHTIDDCRNRHSLICKKRYDGTTIPIQLSSTLVRYGFQSSNFNYTFLIIILIIVVILLIILWLLYQKYQRRSTVAAVNRGQRTPTVADTQLSKSAKAEARATRQAAAVTAAKTKTSATDAVKRIIETSAKRTTSAAEEALQKTIAEEQHGNLGEPSEQASENHADQMYNGSMSPRIRTDPNQPIPHDDMEAGHSRSGYEDETSRFRLENLADVENGAREEPTNGDAERGFGDTLDVRNVGRSDSFQSEDEPPTPRDVTPSQQLPPPPPAQPDRSHLYVEKADKATIKVLTRRQSSQALIDKPRANGTPPASALTSVLPPVGEPTRAPQHAEPASTRSRGTHHPPTEATFERPHVGPLDNVSAISLDEFWQKN